MIGSLPLAKRGVSPIIGYVLLIVLALGLAGGVYSYLTRYTPSTNEQCPEDVRLAIQEVRCANQEVNLTLTNRGLFTADGAYIRIGEPGRAAKTSLVSIPQSEQYFSTYSNYDPLYATGLKPGDGIRYHESYTYATTGGPVAREIEVQPLILAGDETAQEILCPGIVTLQIECS